MVRVIAGKAKGQRLKVPKVTVTRPATDLVRGAIFSILENTTDDWEQVLDLFSGSGALGIEALSRGAAWVDFVERDRRCYTIIKENLEKTGFSTQAHIYCCNVVKAFTFLDKEYSIILMDPPYSEPSIGNLVSQLSVSRLMGERTVLVVTHSPHFPLIPTPAALKLAKEHRHGDSIITLYRKEGKA